MKILFVCRGNVGRSQMAEAILKSINNKHHVASAGTRVVSKEGESRHGQILKDLPAAENVILSLRDKGIGVAENTRTQLNPEMVEWADKIIVMAEPATVPDYLAQSPKAIYWEVKDPKGTPLEEHKNIMNQIEGLINNFIEESSL
jgi:protein-tyrosine-phosphatase